MNITDLLNSSNDFTAYVKVCKAALKLAIEGKGVVVGESDLLSTYANKVVSITGGGGTTYIVQYLDWDDSVIKSQYVLPNGDVLPPSSNPSREGYNFIGWSGTSYNVQSDLTITAQYEYAPNAVVFTDYQGKIISTQSVGTGADAVPPTVDWGNIILDSWSDYTNIQGVTTVIPTFHTKDNATYLTIVLDETTGLSPSLYVWPSSSGTTNIFWGDGTSSDTFKLSMRFSHTYPMYGTYTIKVVATVSASIGYAPNSLPNQFEAALIGTYAKACKKALCGTVVRDSGAAFIDNTGLEDICHLYPSGYADSKPYKGCTSLSSIMLPLAYPTIGTYLFNGCSSLKTLILRSETMVTLSALSAFTGCHADLRIYVPASLLDTYKADATWSTIENKIFALNDLAVYGN